METDKEIVNEMDMREVPAQDTPVEPEPVVASEEAMQSAPEPSMAESLEEPAGTSDISAAAAPVTPPEDGKEKKTFLRACGSWTDIFPIAAMLSIIVTYSGALASMILDATVIPARQIGMSLLGDADSVEFLIQYFEFYGIWLVFMLVILLFKDNWPMWKAYLYNGHGNNLKSIFAGILLGFGINGFCVLMSSIRGDIKLSFNGFNPLLFFVFLFCVMIQSGAEEIVDRCYLYQKLRRRYRWPAIAVLVNAAVFMAMHMGNPGVTKLGLLQVFLIGILFSLIVYYWDSLWTVIWAHTAWNFSQSIVFGLPNSGIVSKYSVFKLDAASARDGIFYNTSFGIEGSIGANAIIGAAIVVILIYALVTKRGEKMDHWKEMEKRDAGKNHIWEAVVLTIIMIAAVATVGFGAWYANEHREELQQYYNEQLQDAEQQDTQDAAQQNVQDAQQQNAQDAAQQNVQDAQQQNAQDAAQQNVQDAQGAQQQEQTEVQTPADTTDAAADTNAAGAADAASDTNAAGAADQSVPADNPTSEAR